MVSVNNGPASERHQVSLMSNSPQSCDLGTEGVTRGQQAFPMKWTHPPKGSPGHGGQASAGRSPGRMGRRWSGPAGAPRWPRSLPGQPPPWATPREPCGRLSSLQTPGSEGGGEEGRHCCGFAAKEGTYLGYLGDGQGTAPLPPGSACQRSAAATCHLRNVFIFSQSLARFPPHPLRAGRGGQEREGEGHRGEPRGIGKLVPQSSLCKENTPEPAKSGCHTA